MHEIPVDRSRRKVLLIQVMLILVLATLVVLPFFLPQNSGGHVESGHQFFLEALPPGTEGIELPIADSAEPCRAQLRILVRRDEQILVRGKRVEWRGPIQELTDQLSISRTPTSGLPVLISAHQEVRWRVVQWVMRSCLDAGIWVDEFGLEARGARELTAIRILPPKEYLIGESPGAGIVLVELGRHRHETATRVAVLGSEIGTGEEGLALLADRLIAALEATPDLQVEINAWVWVPYGEVVRTLDILRQCGITDFRLVGLPPIPD